MNSVIYLDPLVDLNEYINAERSNRFHAAKLKKEETERVAWQIKKQKIPAFQTITRIVFIWKHKDKRKDFDNVEFSQKFIKDGMVMAGIIKNDSWLYFPTTTIHDHLVDRKHPGCEVLIEGSLIADE
jgi:Holliday junction resolvase RusA-like endonuclease